MPRTFCSIAHYAVPNYFSNSSSGVVFEPWLAGLHSNITGFNCCVKTCHTCKVYHHNIVVTCDNKHIWVSLFSQHAASSLLSFVVYFALQLLYVAFRPFCFCYSFNGWLCLTSSMDDYALRVFSCSLFRAVLQTWVQSRTLATLVLCQLCICLEALVAISQLGATDILIK